MNDVLSTPAPPDRPHGSARLRGRRPAQLLPSRGPDRGRAPGGRSPRPPAPHHVGLDRPHRFAVIVFGGWQLFTELGWVDKFFFGQPTAVWDSLVHLFTQGTAFGSIWENLWVTVQEALLGFAVGTIAGMIVGILLGSNRYLAEVCGPYIKIVNAIPPHRARFHLHRRVRARHARQGAAGRRAGVLRGLLQRLPGRAGSGSEPHLERAGAGCVAAAGGASRHDPPLGDDLDHREPAHRVRFAIIGALVAEVLGAQRGIGLIISQAQGSFDPNTVFACMVIIAAFTLVAEYLISLLEKRVLRWRPPTRSEASSI